METWLCSNCGHNTTKPGINLDYDASVVYFDGKGVRLTPLQFQVVHLIKEKSGDVISKEEVFSKIYEDQEKRPNKKILDVLICNINRKLRDKQIKRRIVTINRVGIRIE